jgi:hypothetical protein
MTSMAVPAIETHRRANRPAAFIAGLSGLMQAGRARYRRSRRSRSLPVLFDEHPEARLATRRRTELTVVPVDRIRGSASQAGQNRRPDFLPRPFRESADFDMRWQMLLDAYRRQVVLPPVELMRFGGEYWVVDGHNRLALARHVGQVEIDSVVTDLDAGAAESRINVPENLAAPFVDGSGLRTAGAGRLTPRAPLVEGQGA